MSMIEEGVVEEKGGGGGGGRGRDGIKLSERRGLMLTKTAEEYINALFYPAMAIQHQLSPIHRVDNLECLFV